ncbi:MAG: hypothetical protein JRI36_09475 [Deltaproteobacteria bacterium]|nr:hypothetical protein [Deltaproteobacteria bacterium]
MIYGKQHLVAAVLVLAGLFGYCPSTQGLEDPAAHTLEVIGTGIIDQGNVAKARDEAIEQGLWNAVEQSVQKLIQTSSVVGYFQLLNDRVYSQPELFIQDYQVLTESKSGRCYRVLVKATLLMDTLKDKLREIGVLMSEGTLPAILFLVSEQNIGQAVAIDSWRQDPSMKIPLAVEDALAIYMKEKGFTVINPGSVLADQIPPKAQAPTSMPDDETAIRLAGQTGADVVVVGVGTAQYSGNVLGTEMRSVEATFSARALKVENGALIGTVEGAGAAVHANEIVAGAQALTTAAARAAQELVRRIKAYWNGQTAQSTLVELVIDGIREYVDFVKFRRTLKNDIHGIRNVYLRAIRAGEAKIDVDFQGDARSLADELLFKDFGGFGVNIFEVADKTIKLELIPKSQIQPSLPPPQESNAESW